MKAYKIEVLVIDHDGIGDDNVGRVLTNANFPNDCISPFAMSVQSADIGEWHDDHPLNKFDTMKQEYDRLFNTTP